MKKVIGLMALILVLILACSKPSNNPTSSEEIWWNSPDPDAQWITVSDCCGRRIPAIQASADSICTERGYMRSTGYEQEDCYVGGERRVVLFKVACSVD